VSDLFDIESVPYRGVRKYSDHLTADINQKGVLDVDTVKGCTAGMAALPGVGCYHGCYAAKIANFRGIDFSTSVVRKVHSASHAQEIERAVRNAPDGFFRVGTMGDPSHAWEHTTAVVEWLAPLAVPVVVTKHWIRATNDHFSRLVACGAVLNTSVSALDTEAQLAHRLRELHRYSNAGGVSVARVVSCDFNTDNDLGHSMNLVQQQLLSLPNVIDNPLRVPKSHQLVKDNVIRVEGHQDLGDAPVTVSKANPSTYVGPCSGCTDKCGLAFLKPEHPRPTSPQLNLFQEQTDQTV
jgi:hypothetical protein